uniref:Uncharacterized protein n=1 Tax=Tetranychus urticae TaxID=32264 RepID=T1KSM4_TETUR
MVAPSLWLLTSVLIMTFGHFGHKSCHRSCSQVTFYLPQSRNSQCSTGKSSCLMEATITVDPTEDLFERVNITLTQLTPGDYLRDHVMFFTLVFPGYRHDNGLNNPTSGNTNGGYLSNTESNNGLLPYGPNSANSYLHSYSSNHNHRHHGVNQNYNRETTVINYSCRLLSTGNAIAEVIQGNGLKYSYVSNSSKSCSFIFNRYDYLWPTLSTHQKVDLINNGDFTVTIGYDDITKDLRPESLPLHKMAFLRCCHRHHGGSKYLVIIEPAPTPISFYSSSLTSQSYIQRRPAIDFYLQAYSPIPRTVILELTGPSEQSLRVNVSNSYFNVSILTDGEWISVLNNLTLPRIPRRSDPFDDFRLNWTLPVLLETPRGSIVIEEGQYVLDIESDVSYGHREKVYITD